MTVMGCSCDQLRFEVTNHHDDRNSPSQSVLEKMGHCICGGHLVDVIFCNQRFSYSAFHGCANSVGEKSLVEGNGVVCVGTFFTVHFLYLPKV